MILVTAPAHADELGLAPGEVEAALSLEIDQTVRLEWLRTSIAPDLFVGVTPKLTLGLVHSSRGVGRLDSGASFCFGDAQRCDGIYDAVALDARWRLRAGTLSIAAHPSFLLRDRSPVKPALRLGLLVRARRGRFSLLADPQLQLGLYNNLRGNRTTLHVPVWLRAEVGGGVTLALWTGLDGELATFGDAYVVPLGLEAGVTIRGRLDLLAGGGFSTLLGPQNDHKPRHLWLRLAVRWP